MSNHNPELAQYLILYYGVVLSGRKFGKFCISVVICKNMHSQILFQTPTSKDVPCNMYHCSNMWKLSRIYRYVVMVLFTSSTDSVVPKPMDHYLSVFVRIMAAVKPVLDLGTCKKTMFAYSVHHFSMEVKANECNI